MRRKPLITTAARRPFMREPHNRGVFLPLLLWLSLAVTCAAEVRLPSILTDHMVLQRNARLPIWGWANPGETVTVSFRGQKLTATADPAGKWKVVLAPLTEGGPFELVVAGTQTVILTQGGSSELVVAGTQTVIVHDILVGEVWLCSGQSNMNWPLSQAANGSTEVPLANFPEIRLFKTMNIVAAKPAPDVYGGWTPCTSEAAASFSAVAYFFGKTLHRRLGVPVGLVLSAWDGSGIPSWISADALRTDVEFQQPVAELDAQLKRYDQILTDYRAKVDEWEKTMPYQDPGNTGFAKGWADLNTPVADWKTMNVPGLYQAAIGGDWFNGIVWFRKEVEIPEAWAGQDLTLTLGPCDDFDWTYFSNSLVGHTGPETTWYYVASRRYRIPGKLVKAGRALIAVRILDHGGGGGLDGVAGQLSLSPTALPGQTPIGLAGSWTYRIEHVFPKALHPTEPPPYPFGGSHPGVLCGLFNGKLAGIMPFAIRGALWYQAEGTSNGYQYRRLLPLLIKDWRAHWGQGDFPFHIVQMPNLGVRPAQPADSGEAEVREAQLLASQMPGNGLAVTVDIGDPNDNHPRNKEDAGYRLAVSALEKTYGFKDVVGSGPSYRAMTIEGAKIRLRFDHVDGGLTAKGDKLASFAVAGDDRHFVWADAVIDGETIVVSAPEVPPPVAVRYAWADNPLATLYNKAGLPASPFRTDAWPGASWPRPSADPAK